jgi:hypothetical protein
MKASNFIFAAILVVAVATAITAQTSAFTYQGRFTDGGTAANGTYDMQFKLFDSSTVGAGNQVGSTINAGGVIVTSGVFTVQLDYGAQVFSGADRFLEIGVRPSGNAEAYTLLSPRQYLTSAVYAIRAGSTTTADNATQLGGLAANQYVQTNDTRLTDARSPSAGSSNYIQNASLPQTANFNITGNGVAAGTLAGDIVNAATQFNLNGKRILTQTGNGDVFVGFNAGTANSTGHSNSFFGDNSGAANDDGDYNSFFGSNAGKSNKSGQENSFFGSGAGALTNTGDRNSFFGVQAGTNNQSGQNNSAFGGSAGAGITTGSDNAYFGTQTGISISSASRNSFLGSNAGVFSTGNDNAFFGYQSGSAVNNSASFNSFFGNYTGVKTFQGAGNVFFGSYAGSTNEIGSLNTLIGFGADVGSKNLDNASALGAHAYVTQSNSLVLGGISSVNGSGADTNVGIGTTAPNFRLTVKTPTSSYGMVHTDGTVIVGSYVGGSTGGGWFGTKSNHSLSFFVNDGSPAMTIETGGTVKVNTLGAAGSTSLCRNASNQISTCSSSLRYKKDLRPFTRGLSLLNQLKPLTFKWKSDNSDDLGFGAEDIAAVEPLLITRNAKGEVEGVKYDRITAVLVNAVKEQQEQIKQQQSEIQMLKTLVCRRNRRAPVCK